MWVYKETDLHLDILLPKQPVQVSVIDTSRCEKSGIKESVYWQEYSQNELPQIYLGYRKSEQSNIKNRTSYLFAI